MSAPSEWTTPEALRVQVQRAWDTGRLLAASLSGWLEHALARLPG
jgi:hypothetical protein